MLKILSFSYEEHIKHISSGNTNQDIFGGFIIKSALAWTRVSRRSMQRKSELQRNQKKTLNKWIPFLFLTETPFSKLK